MPPSNPLPLSIVIIALNEARRIGDCLDSVRALTDDIVVVDAHSCDGTAELCRTRGARVFQRNWTGYSEQKNFGNAQARHDWILSLDADERVSPELAASLRRAFARGAPACAAYTVRFENYFGPRRVRFGAWNPEWHVRLFDRRTCDWNDDEVHEGLRGVEGRAIGRLAGCIRHLPIESRAELAAKTERYSELFAAKLRRHHRAPGWAKIWLNPAWRFGRDFLLRLGLLDGAAGWAIAWEAARYTHLKYWRALPAAPARRPAEWLASGAMTAMLGAVLFSLPANSYRVLWTATEPSVNARTLGSLANQTAGLNYPDDDDDELRGTLPDDDDVLT